MQSARGSIVYGRTILGVVSGFTLIEVMISITILTTAMSAVIGSVYTLHNAAQLAAENRRAREIAQVLIERIQGANFDDLGRDPWSWHRREMRENADDATVQDDHPYVDELGESSEKEFKHRPLVDDIDASAHIYRFLEEYNASIGGGGVSIDNFAKDSFGLPYVASGQYDEYGAIDEEAVAPEGIALPNELIERYRGPERYNSLQFLGILDGHSQLKDLKIYLEYYTMESAERLGSRADWQAQRLLANNRHPQSHTLIDFSDTEAAFDRDAVVINIIMTWERRVGGRGRHEVMVARRR